MARASRLPGSSISRREGMVIPKVGECLRNSPIELLMPAGWRFVPMAITVGWRLAASGRRPERAEHRLGPPSGELVGLLPIYQMPGTNRYFVSSLYLR